MTVSAFQITDHNFCSPYQNTVNIAIGDENADDRSDESRAFDAIRENLSVTAKQRETTSRTAGH